MVEVVGDDEIITPDSMHTLDIMKMKMMIKRLNETVRQLMIADLTRSTMPPIKG